MLAMPVMRHLASMPSLPSPLASLASLASLVHWERAGWGCGAGWGAGTGPIPDALLSQPRFKGKITALDASTKMLDLARAKLSQHGNRITFCQHDAQSLPFDDASFDVVTCLEALEFMRDWRNAVREMLRVLKPGGLLMISNRIGPDAWKLPSHTLKTNDFVAWLCEIGVQNAHPTPWLVITIW